MFRILIATLAILSICAPVICAQPAVYLHNRPLYGEVLAKDHIYYMPLQTLQQKLDFTVATEGATIWINGRKLPQPALNINGRCYVPLEDFAAKAGLRYMYNQNSGIIDLYRFAEAADLASATTPREKVVIYAEPAKPVIVTQPEIVETQYPLYTLSPYYDSYYYGQPYYNNSCYNRKFYPAKPLKPEVNYSATPTYLPGFRPEAQFTYYKPCNPYGGIGAVSNGVFQSGFKVNTGGVRTTINLNSSRPVTFGPAWNSCPGLKPVPPCPKKRPGFRLD